MSGSAWSDVMRIRLRTLVFTTISGAAKGSFMLNRTTQKLYFIFHGYVVVMIVAFKVLTIVCSLYCNANQISPRGPIKSCSELRST